MRSSVFTAQECAIGNPCNSIRGTAIDCSAAARAARGIWPSKTAEHWAAAAECQPRMAAYWLSGNKAVSDAAKLALIRAILS